MLLGELIRNNYDIDRADITIKALETFMSLDYQQAETELEGYILNDMGNSDTSNLLFDIDARILEHLEYILNEFGVTLNPDHTPSISELTTLVNGIVDVSHYENVEELLDLVEGQEDDVERLVEALELVVKETMTGNLLDYYNIVASTTDKMWKNITLTAEGTKEDIISFDATPIKVKAPTIKGVVWEWIEMSGRTNYDLTAAFALMDSKIDEMLSENPTRIEIQKVLLELVTLVQYSSVEDKGEDTVLNLLEELTESPDAMLIAQGYLPYIDLGIDNG